MLIAAKRIVATAVTAGILTLRIRKTEDRRDISKWLLEDQGSRVCNNSAVCQSAGQLVLRLIPTMG